MFDTLPELNYSWVTLRQLCGRLRQQSPVIDLACVRVTLKYFLPDYLPGKLMIQEHTHAYYEAHLILSGNIEYLSDTPQQLAPGHVFILPPQLPHSWRVLDSPCLDLNMSFNLDPCIPITLPNHWPVCPKLFWELALLFDDLTEEGSRWQERVGARLRVIFSELFSILTLPGAPTPSVESTPHTLATIEQFLLEHISTQLSLDDIAAAVGLGRRSLTRYFRRQTGISVMEYLHRLRMQSAVGMLLNTDLPIAMVGREIGIPETSYFCRSFRQHTGMTPNAYRRIHAFPIHSFLNQEMTTHNR